MVLHVRGLRLSTHPKPRSSRVALRSPVRIAVVTARWNTAVTDRLLRGAVRAAREAGVPVSRYTVAGAFELPAAVEMLALTGRFAAIVPLGCLIRGETAHFDVLSNAVCRALIDAGIRHAVAVPFGVLTCETTDQAVARSGGAAGDLGAEAMAAALGLVALRQSVVPLAEQAETSATLTATPQRERQSRIS